MIKGTCLNAFVLHGRTQKIKRHIKLHDNQLAIFGGMRLKDQWTDDVVEILRKSRVTGAAHTLTSLILEYLKTDEITYCADVITNVWTPFRLQSALSEPFYSFKVLTYFLCQKPNTTTKKMKNLY